MLCRQMSPWHLELVLDIPFNIADIEFLWVVGWVWVSNLTKVMLGWGWIELWLSLGLTISKFCKFQILPHLDVEPNFLTNVGQKVWFYQNFDKKNWVQIFLGSHKFRPRKHWVQKFGKNWVSYSFDIPSMDKGSSGQKYCLDKWIVSSYQVWLIFPSVAETQPSQKCTKAGVICNFVKLQT